MQMNWKRDARRIALVLLGAVLLAANIKCFIRPGGLYPGGVSGLSLLLQEIFARYMNVQLSYTFLNLLINSVPIVISFLFIGRKFTIYSCIAIVVASVLTDIMPGYSITQTPLLNAVFGGIIQGTAVSCCLLADATSGGMDFIAIFMSERYNKDTWHIVLGMNVVILLSAGLLFGWEAALYSIIFQYTSTQIINAVYKRYQKNTLFIVTDHPEDVYRTIAENTHHGATLFRGTGLYENKERSMLYSVVSSEEAKRVIHQVRIVDPKAFINCMKTESISGRFYKRPND